MCGRIVRDRHLDYKDYGLVEPLQETRAKVHIPLTWNLAPTQEDVVIRPTKPARTETPMTMEPGGEDPIVRPAADGGREIVNSHWGLIPSWAKDRTGASKMINARAETLLEKPSFRSLVKANRCVIRVTGFYEWAKEGGRKVPYHFNAWDGRSLALAGLWTRWTDPATGEQLITHTIITTDPNETMKPFHHRMPVILSGPALDLWLDASVTDPTAVTPLLVPAPDDLLVADRASMAVNNVNNNGPQLLLALGD